MKSVKNKWKGTKITVNYIGNLNNKFGIKKKKIFLEEDKLETLFLKPNNNLISPKIINKNKTYFHNPIKINSNNFNNEKSTFKSIHIRDWEKDNNYNFYNYLKNLKYFERINNSKRILSSKNRQRINKNNSGILLFESELNKDINGEKENNYYSAKRRKKTNYNMKNNFNKNRKEKLSKKNITEIISNFITQKTNERKIFNHKNKIINDNLKNKNLLNLDFYNSKSNSFIKVKTNVNKININSKNLDKMSKNYSNKKIFLFPRYNNNNKERPYINKNKIDTIINPLLNSYNPSNPHLKVVINQDNNNIINNIKLISPRNTSHYLKKSGSFCDAATNTDL